MTILGLRAGQEFCGWSDAVPLALHQVCQLPSLWAMLTVAAVILP